jgi:hypothetical protein
MYINVFDPIVTNSWTMTANTGAFPIDKIRDGGMTFKFDCEFPC